MASTDPSRPIDLVIDVGNSRAKLGLFSGARVLRHGWVVTGDLDGVRTFLGSEVPRRIAIGSVAGEPAWSVDMERIAPVHRLTGASPSRLTTAYEAPLTLGVDRLANVVQRGGGPLAQGLLDEVPGHVQPARAAGQGRRVDPRERTYRVRTVDVDGDIAAASVQAAFHVDLFHLVRTDDGWRIIHALWRGATDDARWRW